MIENIFLILSVYWVFINIFGIAALGDYICTKRLNFDEVMADKATLKVYLSGMGVGLTICLAITIIIGPMIYLYTL